MSAEAGHFIDFLEGDPVEQIKRIYERGVDECAKRRANKFLSNKTPEHARYIISKIFENAEHEVRLWTNGMPREVDGEPIFGSPELIEAAKAFLDKPDTTLSVIVNGAIDIDEGQVYRDHPFLGAILSHENVASQTRMCHAYDPENDLNRLLVGMHGFAVMDKAGYRLETEADSSALVNFGDRETAESLAETFDTVMSYAK